MNGFFSCLLLTPRSLILRAARISVLVMPLSLFLAGCGLFADAPPPPQTPPGPVEAYMISAAPGSSTSLDDPEFGLAVRVTVDEVFTSAKGENCKRGTVLAGQKEAEVVVICRDGQGRWQLAPRVWGQGIDIP